MFCLLYFTGLLIVMFNIVGGSHSSECTPGRLGVHALCQTGGLMEYGAQNVVLHCQSGLQLLFELFHSMSTSKRSEHEFSKNQS